MQSAIHPSSREIAKPPTAVDYLQCKSADSAPPRDFLPGVESLNKPYRSLDLSRLEIQVIVHSTVCRYPVNVEVVAAELAELKRV
jgi:hypothetical protein